MSRILVSLGGNGLGTDFDELQVVPGARLSRCAGLGQRQRGLTGVEKVAVNYNTAEQQDLDDLTVAHTEKYLAGGQVPEGSMPPKIRTASRFTTSGPGRKTLMTSLDKLVEGLKGQTGKWIVP